MILRRPSYRFQVIVADTQRKTQRRVVDPARRAAYDALRAVHADHAYANLILPRLLDDRGIHGRDAAFATELLAGTCRLEGTYDLIIAAAAGRKINSLQPAVLDVLRLGAHQVLSMRVPPHAAVAATVNLAAAAVGDRVTGITNAVLRKVAAQDWTAWTERLSAGADDRHRLAITTAHPGWVVDAYADVLPTPEWEPALLANNVSPPISLAVRPGLVTVEELQAAGATPGRLSPFAASWTGNPADLTAVRDGRAGAQDEGSQLVAWGLTRVGAPPGRWLDLCAGPGGKTALLTGLARADGSAVVANEISAHRARLVVAAVRAYPLDQRATVMMAEGGRPAWRPGSFSRVLADVPCTGLGALRRRSESRWRRSPADVEQLHALQSTLLAAALDATAPGGVVGYVTCSPHRRETSDVVEEALASRPEFTVLDAADVLPELAEATRGPYLQLWPHRHGTDAMFAAYLRRR